MRESSQRPGIANAGSFARSQHLFSPYLTRNKQQFHSNILSKLNFMSFLVLLSLVVLGAFQPVPHILVDFVVVGQPSEIFKCLDHPVAEFGLELARLLVLRQVFVPRKQILHPHSSIGQHFAVILTQDCLDATVLGLRAQENVCLRDTLAAIASACHLLDVGVIEEELAVH